MPPRPLPAAAPETELANRLRLRDLRNQINDLRRTNDSLEADVISQERANETLKANQKAAEAQVTIVQNQIQEQETELATSSTQAKEVIQEVSEMSAQLEPFLEQLSEVHSTEQARSVTQGRNGQGSGIMATEDSNGTLALTTIDASLVIQGDLARTIREMHAAANSKKFQSGESSAPG